MEDPTYKGDRGLIKEHALTYEQLIRRLLVEPDLWTVTSLAEVLTKFLKVAIITRAEDDRLADLPADWDLETGSQWVRYENAVPPIDPSTFGPFPTPPIKRRRKPIASPSDC